MSYRLVNRDSVLVQLWAKIWSRAMWIRSIFANFAFWPVYISSDTFRENPLVFQSEVLSRTIVLIAKQPVSFQSLLICQACWPVVTSIYDLTSRLIEFHPVKSGEHQTGLTPLSVCLFFLVYIRAARNKYQRHGYVMTSHSISLGFHYLSMPLIPAFGTQDLECVTPKTYHTTQFPKKGPIMWKGFSCHDVIIISAVNGIWAHTTF